MVKYRQRSTMFFSFRWDNVSYLNENENELQKNNSPERKRGEPAAVISIVTFIEKSTVTSPWHESVHLKTIVTVGAFRKLDESAKAGGARARVKRDDHVVNRRPTPWRPPCTCSLRSYPHDETFSPKHSKGEKNREKREARWRSDTVSRKAKHGQSSWQPANVLT